MHSTLSGQHAQAIQDSTQTLHYQFDQRVSDQRFVCLSRGPKNENKQQMMTSGNTSRSTIPKSLLERYCLTSPHLGDSIRLDTTGLMARQGACLQKANPALAAFQPPMISEIPFLFDHPGVHRITPGLSDITDRPTWHLASPPR
jgi:hypothetical protein